MFGKQASNPALAMPAAVGGIHQSQTRASSRLREADENAAAISRPLERLEAIDTQGHGERPRPPVLPLHDGELQRGANYLDVDNPGALRRRT